MITNLQQYTQYAYYIKTQLSIKNADNIINVTQGQSSIKYFRMFPDRPGPPIVTTIETTDNSISLKWVALVTHLELIDRFYMEIFQHVENMQQLDERNYCDDPMQSDVQHQYNQYDESNLFTLCCQTKGDKVIQLNASNNTTKCDEAEKFYFQYEKYFRKNNQQEDCCINDPEFNLAYRRYGFQFTLHETLKQLDVSRAKHRMFNWNSSRNYKLLISQKNISSALTQYKVNGLNAFTLYTFHIYGCNRRAGCGTYFMHNERTKSSSNGNDVTLHVQHDGNSDSASHLIFHVPKNSNGHITSFNVQRFIWQSNNIEVDCITRRKHVNNNFR